MIEARGVTVTRGGIPVLEGVDLRLSAGEALVLRGPNGSGKTTLLRALAGLQPVVTGEVLRAEDIAYAGHADGVKSALTVAENLSFWAGIYGTGDVASALDAFEIAPLAHRPAQSLSAGQRRRVGLARLLVTGQKIWALDEPTVSLDTPSVEMFARAVRAHLAAGGAAIIATHISMGLEARVLEIGRFKARPPAVEPVA